MIELDRDYLLIREAGERMHSFLRAIGFSSIKTRNDLEKLVGIIMQSPTETHKIQISDSVTLTEISTDFIERMGITIRGEYDEKGFFHLEHYFPYYRGINISVQEEVMINKKVDTESYTGMCDDLRLGVSLIFYLQNSIDYVKNRKKYETEGKSNIVPVALSGLSIEGKVLLGMNRNQKQIENRVAESNQRNQLIAEARKGNQEAIDSLTIDDIDMYAMISRRARYEDVYTIVDTSFIPYGSESDNYSIIAMILDSELYVNPYTKEEVYDMQLECNELIFNICINKKDLLGEPKVGRRFKGNIWLQGNIDFYTH